MFRSKIKKVIRSNAKLILFSLPSLALIFNVFNLTLTANVPNDLKNLKDTTIINTSFETTDTPPYSLGNISGQNLWTNSGGVGTAVIVNETTCVKSGNAGLKFTANNEAMDFRHTPYSGTVPGITGIVYFDVYVKILSSATKEFTICGYDLFSTSTKRTFVIDFTVPVNDTGAVRIFDGSNKVRLGSYQINQWYRVTAKVNYEIAKYSVCLDAGPSVTVNFRESYTPTASGSRQAEIKEYHQLRFNLGGGSTTAATGSVNAAVDLLYAGTTCPAGVIFDNPTLTYTVTVTQPYVGSITLDPPGPTYDDSSFVTATLVYPRGYKNFGWTGDLSGTDTVKVFQVTKNMSISANVGVDALNPPPKYTITVNQPLPGSIALSPVDTSYYENTLITATLTFPPGYISLGWNGDLSGTELVKNFRILQDMTIGANVVEDTIMPSRRVVSTVAQLKSALQVMVPGDTIEVVNGTYDFNGNVSITRSGTAARPILIRAQNRDSVNFTNKSYFTLKQVAYITIEGFLFTSKDVTSIKTESCNYLRVTRNTFRLQETSSLKWILIGGTWNIPTPNSSNNRIDHNLFENKAQLGNFIAIDGSPEPNALSSQYDRIDHNHFRNIGPRAVNDMEAIRVGWSEMSMSSGFTKIEYNLFENCDGDPEIIAVKTCDNIIRYNTFRNCQGTLSLRHGNRNIVEGNFFFGNGKAGTGGVRVYGDDHKIFNNYFEGLTGTTWDAPIALTNGDADSGNTDLTKHFRPRRCVFAFNTFVNNTYNIEIGFTNSGNYTKAPRDNQIVNNLVVGSQNELVKIYTNPINMIWLGNIMYPTGSAVLGISAAPNEIKVVDPLLVQADSLWRLSPASPARDSAAGMYSFAIFDVDGQLRNYPKDVGADEYSISPIILRPFSAVDVGPNSTRDDGDLPILTAVITGKKYNDVNGDSSIVGDDPIEGWLIKIYKDGTFVNSYVTNANGEYYFNDLAPGTYTIEESLKVDWMQTYPKLGESGVVTSTYGTNPGPNAYSVTVSAGDIIIGKDFGNKLISNLISKNIIVKSGWNLLSVPVSADDMSKPGLFPLSVSSAYAYSGGYVAEDTLKNTKGYWLKFNSADTVAINGYKVAADTVPVVTGWNLIGIFDQDVPVSSITTIPGNIISSSFYEYNAGYFSAVVLESGKGYWVKVNQSGVIVLPGSLNNESIRINLREGLN